MNHHQARQRMRHHYSMNSDSLLLYPELKSNEKHWNNLNILRMQIGKRACEQFVKAKLDTRQSIVVSLTVTVFENKMDVRKHFQHFLIHSDCIQKKKIHGVDLQNSYVAN